MQVRKRNRMQGFDYKSDAIYFVTICTKDKIHRFGKVENGKMIFNESGMIAENQIRWLEKQYPYFELHNFVVMPNHVHILFELNRKESINIKSVSSLIGAFKTTSSKQIHLDGDVDFFWQRSFHDHIVRTENRYELIFNYITNNTVNWGKDKFY